MFVEKPIRRRTKATFNGQWPIPQSASEADPSQEKIINAREKTIRVLAPAGSGKTQTILNRVLKRIEEGASPSSFLILTFDNSAVSSIVTKLEERSNGSRSGLDRLQIQTLNSLGYEILRDHFPDEYRPVIAESRKRRLFQEVKNALREKCIDRFSALPLKLKDQFYLEFFGLLKNELLDPRDLEPQRFADLMVECRQAQVFFEVGAKLTFVRSAIEAVGWMFKAYECALQREQLIDFDDQKLRAYKSLRENAKVLKSLQRKYVEIIVDEFQDINRLDFALIKLLAEKSDLMITGDDDQAIYGFRNCSSDFIIDLEKHLARKVASYELKINYRNPDNLVAHAARLIGHNSRRIRKHPVSDTPGKATIEVASSLTPLAEAKLAVSFIQKLKRRNPEMSDRDFAVLYRINSQSLTLQVQLALNNIPYIVGQQDHILRNEALAKLLGCLRLKLSLQARIQPAAEDAVLTVEAFLRSLDGSTSARLRRLFSDNRDFFETLNSKQVLEILPRIKERRAAEFIREFVNAPSLMRTLTILANRFPGLSGMTGKLDESLAEQSPLGGIFDLASDFAGETQRFVATVETALKRAGQNRNTGEQGVALLTYFKAKGRQWRSVVLTGCHEGMIPHKRAALEDERRLFYVAMTRATSNLLITYSNRMCNTAVAPSRFLSEAGLL